MGRKSTKTIEDFKGSKVIDSRDVIARLEELEGDQETAMEGAREVRERVGEIEEELARLDEDKPTPEEREKLEEEKETLLARLWKDEKLTGDDGEPLEYDSDVSYWDEGTAEEYRVLKAFAEEAEGYASDWIHGATLISVDYFEEYCQEFAEDIGAIGKNLQWPCNHIDWKAAAEELMQDYTEVDMDGEGWLMQG